jgi:hypothetical protein
VAVSYEALNIAVHPVPVVTGLYDLSGLADAWVRGGDLAVRFGKKSGPQGFGDNDPSVTL